METAQKVIKQVCMVWDITPELLLGQSRRAHHAEPRMVAAYVMMKLGMNATEAGRALGGRHPSTITHAHDVVSGRMPSNRRLADKVNLIVEACEVQARVYIPLNGYANPSDTYQLLRQHLEIIDTLRAQTLHAMSLLPEPPQRDIPPVGEWNIPTHPSPDYVVWQQVAPVCGDKVAGFESRDDLPVGTAITLEGREFVISSREPLTSGKFQYRAKLTPADKQGVGV